MSDADPPQDRHTAPDSTAASPDANGVSSDRDRPPLADAHEEAIAAHLEDYDRVVEVGIGRRPGVARRLAAAGLDVTATDVRPRPTPEGVTFVRDDVLDPDPSLYRDAGAVYALGLPPELHRPALGVAHEVGADLLFTTLGGDPPVIPVRRESIPGGTLYVARKRGSGRDQAYPPRG